MVPKKSIKKGVFLPKNDPKRRFGGVVGCQTSPPAKVFVKGREAQVSGGPPGRAIEGCRDLQARHTYTLHR
jgi:hypothetical protein